MAISKDECGVIAIGALVVGLCLYYAYLQQEQPIEPPDKQIAGATFNETIDSMTASEFFTPENVISGQVVVYTKHRYPTVTGGNISTLIHRGFSAVRRKPQMDAGWFMQPPGDVEW